MTPAYLIQGNNLILVIDGKSHVVSKDTHITYDKIVDAIKASDWDAVRNFIEPKLAIINFGKGNITIENGVVYWKGNKFHNALSSRMISMYQDGFSIDPMLRFMENLMNNPSKRSVDQVYGFLEKNSLPITEDGHFLAYKKVNTNYTDIHSGTIDNSIGRVVEMERNLVDDNPESHCSVGLHFCSESYLRHFGNAAQPVMILKINPADVVSVPTDYDGAKGRCMRYEVVAEVPSHTKHVFASSVNSDYSGPDDGWNDDDDDRDNDDRDDDWSDEDDNDERDDWDDDFYGDRTPVADPTESWPFPKTDEIKPPLTQLYDCIRVSTGVVIYTGLTLSEAQNKCNKNISQKKAVLRIVKIGTTTSV